MNTIGSYFATNINDFGGGANTLETDLRDLGLGKGWIYISKNKKMLGPNGLSARAYSRRELRERAKHRFGRNPDLVTVTSDNAGFGAVPPIDLLTHPRSYEVFTGYTPNCHYLTAADYESLRETGTLEEGVVYIVIN